MPDQEIIFPKETNNGVSFGIFVFCIFFLIPIILFSAWTFHRYTEKELSLECMKQQRTYVNGMCLQALK